MKKFLSLITAVAVILSMASYSVSAEELNTESSGEYSDSVDTAETDAVALAEEETANKFSFALLSDDTYEISCPEENRASLTGEIVIPATYNGKPVSRIAAQGFDHCENITSVVIEDGITDVGIMAFWLCFNLQSVSIPQSVTNIGFGVFGFSEKLAAIEIDAANPAYCTDDGVLFTKDKTMLVSYPTGRAAANYTVPNTVTTINNFAFSGSFNLADVVIPEGVRTIKNGAFNYCYALSSVSIPASVTEIEDNVFCGCEKLEVTIAAGNNSYCIDNGVIFDKNKTTLIAYLSSKKDEEYTVPAGVTKIGFNALSNNQNIKVLIIPEGVSELGGIENCWYLNTLTLPKSLTRLDGIHGMDRLHEIKYGGTKAEWDALIADLDSVGMEQLLYVNVTCAPDEIDETTGLAFELLDDGTYAVFCPVENRSSLKGELVIPGTYKGKTVSTIASQGFANCPNITSVVIGNGITDIKDFAISGCEKLETISLSESVENTAFSFGFNPSLKSFIVDEANRTYCSVDGILFSKDMQRLVTYPSGRPDAVYTVPNGVKIISDSAFSMCTNLVEVVLPEGVTKLENNAFNSDPKLKTVRIPASVTELGETTGAFSDCDLLEVTIADGNTSFCEEDGVVFNKDKTELIAYLSSKKDESYEVPASVRKIRGDAFSMNQNIRKLVLNEGLPQFCNIQNCWNLKSITIPKSVTIFEGIAGMDSFKEIIYGGTIAEWFSVKSNHKLDPDGVLDRIKVVCGDGAIGIDPEVTTLETGDIEFRPGVKEDDVPTLDVEAVEVFENLSVTAPEDAKLGGAELFVKLDTEQNVIKTGMAMDLTFIANGKEVQPEGEVAVTFPIPESLKNAKELFVYHISNNKIERASMGQFDPDSNFRTFFAQHFSTYVITDKEYTETDPIVVPVTIDLPKTVDKSTLTVTATDGETNAALTVDEDGNLDISALEDGEYTLTFSANNCAPRSYPVTITNGTLTGLEDDVKLHLIGDINGDGKLTLGDVLKANAAARNSKPLTGYEAAVADINNDGKITLGDVLKMNAHARNSKLLW